MPQVDLTDAEHRVAQQFVRVLGAGERACIAGAKSRNGLFVTDDRKARQVAIEMGIKVTGALGILVGAVKRNIILIGEAEHLLTQMIEYGYRSPVDNLSSLFPRNKTWWRRWASLPKVRAVI